MIYRALTTGKSQNLQNPRSLEDAKAARLSWKNVLQVVINMTDRDS